MDLVRLILAVTGVSLLAFAWPAWRRERQRPFQPEPPWEGSGLDVSGVTPRLRQVRENYLAEIHARPFSPSFHESLLVAARQTVARLSFFTSRPAGELPHGPNNHAA